MDSLNKGLLIDELIQVIKNETKPAVGCTEPVAVALTAATAKKYFKGKLNKIDLKVSRNIFKNGKSVTIPNTEECGVDIAAALGVICGDAEAGLYVFNTVNDTYVEEAKKMLKDKMVSTTPLSDTDAVFVQVDLLGEKEEVTVQLRVVIENQNKGKSASIFYKGPGKELKETFEKIDVNKFWED